MNPKNTKKLFLAGLMGSGTTVTLNLLLSLDFGSGIRPYVESWQDPNSPRKWKGRFCERFPDETRDKIRDWVHSYCKRKWFIEKTPTRFTHFLALQELFGDKSYFIVVQRHPVQVLASRARTRAAHAHPRTETQRKVLERYTLQQDSVFAEMWKSKFANMVKFHRQLRPRLQRFMYIRYEHLCKDPAGVIREVLRFLHVRASTAAIERACDPVELKHVYSLSDFHSFMRPGVKRLMRLWEYNTKALHEKT